MSNSVYVRLKPEYEHVHRYKYIVYGHTENIGFWSIPYA